MQADWPLNPGSFDHALEWLIDIQQRLFGSQAGEYIRVAGYRRHLHQHLGCHVVQMQDAALTVFGVRDEQSPLLQADCSHLASRSSSRRRPVSSNSLTYWAA